MPSRFIYSFGDQKASQASSAILGGKGAQLHEMTRLGFPVPPGFTIGTDVCSFYYDNKKKLPSHFEGELKKALHTLQLRTKRTLGGKKPLLISVRSGAKISMPGMMDTILNLGLNDETVLRLAEETDESPASARFAYDSYRRLISMYGNVVLGIPSHEFEALLEEMKLVQRVEQDSELSHQNLKELIAQYQRMIGLHGKKFPQDPWEQLLGAIRSVLDSWMNARAITYRKVHQIADASGTAVTIQAMVFGNRGDTSATGVAFTRDPSTGEKKFFGEFLVNAQGEDVVAGIRTPHPINTFSTHASTQHLPTLEMTFPKIYRELTQVYKKLEKHYRDMQDIEFTIEEGKLYLLQTRSGKRSAAASLRIAVEMVKERLITKEEAILRVRPEEIELLLHPCLDPKVKKEVLTRGLPASPGAASGQIVFHPAAAEQWAKEGKKVILVRQETSPEDIHGMLVSEGILTMRGGMTSHAAVVARGMGKCCVSGCTALKFDEDQKTLQVGSKILKEGDFLTLDGATGEVILGQIQTTLPTLNDSFREFMKWTDQVSFLQVRANADTVSDAKVARLFGATGIGLCRTEHMFFDPSRIDAVREMILATSQAERLLALGKILPMQKSDFKGLFREMAGFPVTIRLLDPPLHEFLPRTDSEMEALSHRIQLPVSQLKKRVEQLAELNPMLGHRGCRLGVTYPEIYRTQVRAILEAALELLQEEKLKVTPEIMIPLITDVRELEWLKEQCLAEIDELGPLARKISVRIGTMIETPRAALTAGALAEKADFFSFGTNDLTQTTYGLSRDDSAQFLKDYLDARIFEKDPFLELDSQGVGQLMEWACTRGRQAKPGIKIGICGEHAGHPESLALCHALGLDYASCSPYRIPIAKLALAQAEIRKPKRKGLKSKESF